MRALSLRRLAALGLTTYALALAVAAIPPELGVLHGPSGIARALLRAVGIRPGVAVFEAATTPTARIVRNDCIEVRGIDANGQAHVVAPPDGHCVTEGLRLSVPRTEGMLRSLVLRAPPGVAEAAIGDWVCHDRRFEAHAFREVDLVWTAPWVHRATRAEGTSRNALVVWRCDPPGIEQRVLHPSAADLQARPGRAAP